MFTVVDYLLLFGFGALGGLLSGMLGIGGGIIYVIVLNTFLERYGLKDEELVKFVLSNSIAATFFAGISGTIKQRAKGNFYPREILVTGSAGIVSALAVTYSIVHWNWYSKEIFSIFFMAILLLMAINMLATRNKNSTATNAQVTEPYKPFFGRSIYGFIAAGVATGAVSSLTGLGGGVVLIPLLALIGVDMKRAASISLGIIPMQALAMGLYYASTSEKSTPQLPDSFGYIIFPVLLPMLLGVILVAPLGVRIAHRLSQQQIKIMFGMVVVLIFAKTLYSYLYA